MLQGVGRELRWLIALTCGMLSLFSRVQLCATPWTIAPQAPLSMEFSRQEYRSGLPCPPPGDLPNPGIDRSPALQADSLPSEPRGKPNYLHYLLSFSQSYAECLHLLILVVLPGQESLHRTFHFYCKVKALGGGKCMQLLTVCWALS